MPLQSCPVCGSEFETWVVLYDKFGHRKFQFHKKTCSKECSKEARRKGEYRSCGICGNSFYASPREIKRSSAKFCSQECRLENIRRNPPNPPKGRKYVSNGYVAVYAPDHPNAKASYLAEHRLVMEKQLGRYLDPNERVHHVNGVKDDNRPENLEVFVNDSEHIKHHWQNDENFQEGARKRVKHRYTECGNCGKQFRIANAAQKRKYCSRQCVWEARKSRVKKSCEVCGTQFEVQQHLHRRGYGKYCSNKCKAKGTLHGTH